jgi:hypothetical protein
VIVGCCGKNDHVPLAAIEEGKEKKGVDEKEQGGRQSVLPT